MDEEKQHKHDELDSYNEMRHTMQNIQRALDESSIVAITDKNGTIIEVNQKFCDVSKYSKEELIGQNHRILKSGYHPPEFYKGIWHAISHGHTWRGDIKNKAKDGTFYWVETVIVPFLDEQKRITEFVSIRTDITKQKVLQEQLLKSERLITIGTMASRLAHDLKNPLTVIKTYSEILSMQLENQMDDLMKSRCIVLKKSIMDMSRIIEDVLDFVRTTQYNTSPNSIQGILKKSISNLNIVETTTINLPEQDVEINCDARKIEAVFSNLFMNSIQALENTGKINIMIEEESTKIRIKFEDSGPGIPPENIEKIFEPLFTTKETGTGLGLGICKMIIENHGGTLTVKNNPTTFIIELPK